VATNDPTPAAARAASLPPPSLSTTNVLLGVLVAVVLAGTMKLAASVLVPLALAVFVAYLLAPVMAFLGRRGVPEALTLPVTLGLLVACLGGLEVLVAQTVTEIAARAPFYERRLETLAEGLLTSLGASGQALRDVDWVGQVAGAASDLVSVLFGSVIGFVGNLVLVVTYTVFILLGRKSFGTNLARAWDKPRADEIRTVLGQINLQVQRYLTTKILLSAVTGVLMYVTLVLFGVDFALFFGLLGFLLSFIPTVGSAIAALLPIGLALLQFESPLMALWVALSLIAIQQLIGNVVEPKLLGRRLNLSPIVVLFALVLFGWLWGFWGMVMSVPLMASLKIAMSHTRSLKPIAVMLEG
jgi:AI-2 transport protein TqsA